MKAQILIQKLQELDEAFGNPEIVLGLYEDTLQDFLVIRDYKKDHLLNSVTIQLQPWEYRKVIK
jgi:hypothetical protein